MKKCIFLIFSILSIFFFVDKAFSVIITDSKRLVAVNNSSPESSEVKAGKQKLKIELGRRLFFDPVLSKNGKISCASCHKPDHAFADDTRFSIGINGQKGDRNTPTVFNTHNLKFLFWDGRAKSLEEQVIGPIQNPKEMGETVGMVLLKLNKDPYYSKEFKKIYGTGLIMADDLLNAIAEFERTLVSKDSDYDRYIAGNKKALSQSAKRGMDLFFGKAMCAECHKGSDFTDGDFHNIGLPITGDVGRAKVSVTNKDTRKFKTPTLREVAETAPYFHDGSFETLEEVIAFYNAGGGSDTYKDPLKKPLNLNEYEQKDLIEFLKSLNGRQTKIKSPFDKK